MEKERNCNLRIREHPQLNLPNLPPQYLPTNLQALLPHPLLKNFTEFLLSLHIDNILKNVIYINNIDFTASKVGTLRALVFCKGIFVASMQLLTQYNLKSAE